MISLERFISSRRDERDLTGAIFNLSAVKLNHVCIFHFLVYLRFASLTFACKLSANTILTWKYGRYSNFLQLLLMFFFFGSKVRGSNLTIPFKGDQNNHSIDFVLANSHF